MKVGLIVTSREERSSGKLGKNTEVGKGGRVAATGTTARPGGMAATDGIKSGYAISTMNDVSSNLSYLSVQSVALVVRNSG